MCSLDYVFGVGAIVHGLFDVFGYAAALKSAIPVLVALTGVGGHVVPTIFADVVGVA